MPISGTVLVVGDVITDIVVRPEGELVRGADRRAEIRILPGGSGANLACWLAAAGVPTRFAGRVAAADKATEMERFAAFGVEAALAGDSEVRSGRIVTLLAADGERSFFTDRGANSRLSPADLPPALLDRAVHLHVSGYALFEAGPRAAVSALAGEAGRRGIPFSIDAASHSFLREAGVEAFLGWTRGARLLFANMEEAAVLSGSPQPEAQLDALTRHYPVVVVTCGAAGVVAGARGGVRYREPGAGVPAVDATGAGDAFTAGFLAAWLAGEAVPLCLQRGAVAGAEAVMRPGGRPPGREVD